MYFRSLGTKYRPASPRLTARTVQSVWFWSQNTHILYSFDLYLVFEQEQDIIHTQKKTSHNGVLEVLAPLSYARYGWSALLLNNVIRFINQIVQIIQSKNSTRIYQS